MTDNAAVKARFETLIARAVRRCRLTRVLSDVPCFEVPRRDGIVAHIALDNVAAPGNPPLLRIIWTPISGESTLDAADLTDREENDALRVLVGTGQF
jgi:hypothetical protein